MSFYGGKRVCPGSNLARFDFKSDLLRAMYAVTDGFSGLCGTLSTPGTANTSITGVG